MTRYRVWFHPKRGSDTYQEFSSKTSAMRTAQRSPTAEKLIYKVKGRSLLNSTEEPIKLKKIRNSRRVTTPFKMPTFKMPKFRF